jgi:hypothetical protein
VLNATFAPAALVNGINTLAVEIHQQGAGSSDISFDLELTATYPRPLELNLTRAAGAPVLFWFDPAATLEATTDLINWMPIPAGSSPFPFSTDLPKEFFRLRK